MQASKYICLIFCATAAAVALLSGCGEKSPEQIAAENKKQSELSVRRAQVLMFENKSAEAIKLLEETYQKCGSRPELCENLAYAYMQNGQLASAAMFFENAAAQKGGDAELQISAAKAYEQSKAFDSAAKAYEKYLKIKPADPVARRALASPPAVAGIVPRAFLRRITPVRVLRRQVAFLTALFPADPAQSPLRRTFPPKP